MFDESVLTPFTLGAVTGLGQSFGQRLLGWISRLWRRSSDTPDCEPVARQVELRDVKGEIPTGWRLCRFNSSKLVEICQQVAPTSLRAGESLWLVPVGDLLVTPNLTLDDLSAAPEVEVEFEPSDDLAAFLGRGGNLTHDVLSAFVGGMVSDAIKSLNKDSVDRLLQGDSVQSETLLQRLEPTMKQHGLRCKSIRFSPLEVAAQPVKSAAALPPKKAPTDAAAVASDDSGEVAELAAELHAVKSAEDWNGFFSGLEHAGIPWDATASAQLQAMQAELRREVASSEQTVRRLADITAATLERAGIEPPDLRRWSTLAERLAESVPQATASTAPSSPYVSVPVGATKRPSTFWVWNRSEVDRRLLAFLRRIVANCRAACEEFSASGDDMVSLRKARELRERLDIINQMLETTPTLTPETRALRIDGKKAKELVAGLEQAVTSAETLSNGTGKLLQHSPNAAEWLPCADACLRAAATLTQNIRTRRGVR